MSAAHLLALFDGALFGAAGGFAAAVIGTSFADAWRKLGGER